MSRIYLSLGSNIEPQKNIPAAVELLKKNFSLIKASSIFETEPVGPVGPGKFWNLAALLESSEEKSELIKKFRALEESLGRVRSENKFAPRTIDIDILPQPGYQTYAFIIIPLAEIAPEDIDPETGQSFLSLALKARENLKGFRKIRESC